MSDIDELKAAVDALTARIPDNIVRVFSADEVTKVSMLTAMLGDIEVMVSNLTIDHQEFVGTLYQIPLVTEPSTSTTCKRKTHTKCIVGGGYITKMLKSRLCKLYTIFNHIIIKPSQSYKVRI